MNHLKEKVWWFISTSSASIRKMQVFRRLNPIRLSFRLFSTSIIDVNPLSNEKQLLEITKLMKNYNHSHVPIRTYALFEWMINIIDLKPDLNCYLHIVRACTDLNNRNICEKIHKFIDEDKQLSSNEHIQLQIKLIYMYAKIKHIEAAEKLFRLIRNSLSDITLFGTMFKAYNMNGQPEKTIELFENEILKNKSIKLDSISATCVLNACSDCHRLDIGEYIHNEIQQLNLLNRDNIRLATALMDMYCNCKSIDRARQLFDQLFSSVDHITYSILMKAYLSIDKPVEVIELFKQFQQSSLQFDSVFCSNLIQTGKRLGLKNQAEFIHHSIPSDLIEKNPLLINQLIDMHAHCAHLNEAHRLFELLKQKDSYSLANLLHGYAIDGQGRQVLKIYHENRRSVKINEQIYRTILSACAFDGSLVREAQEIYKSIPEKYRTSDVAAAMVSVLARASRFDETISFINQYEQTSKNTLPLWSSFFMICYHSKNIQYAKIIYEKINSDPMISLLFADLTNSSLSKQVLDYFLKQKPGKCWIETNQNGYVIHEFHDNSPESNRDLKRFYCGHNSLRSAVNSSNKNLQITKTKPICSICHEELKQLSQKEQRKISVRDPIRIHHFHNGQCSCHDRF